MNKLTDSKALVPEVVSANPNRDTDLEWNEDEYYTLRQKAIDLDHIMQAYRMAEDFVSHKKLSGGERALAKATWVSAFCGAKDWPDIDKLV